MTNWIVRDACSEWLSSFDFSHGEAWFEQFWANECYSVYRMAADRGFKGHLMVASYYIAWLLGKNKWRQSFYRRARRILYRFEQKTENL